MGQGPINNSIMRYDLVYRACERKVRYKTKQGADRDIRSLKKSGRLVSNNFKPYECIFCNGWHNGHGRKAE